MPPADAPLPEWLGAFFDEHYLATYGQTEGDAEAEVEALAAARLAGAAPGERLLDAPCGYGRHAIALARAGFEVVGLDVSEPLLAEGRRRAGALSGLELVHGDYRQLPFPDGAFDGVLCLCNSLGYLDEDGDAAALGELRRVLATGRRLVLAVAHRDRVVQTFRPRSWSRLPDGSLFLEEAEFDAVAGVLSATQTRVHDLGRSNRSYRLRCYTATELVGLVRAAGFAEVAVAGDWSGGPFDPSSLEAIVTATR